ncbi:hypothetical protein V5F89_01055 [Pelagerythrobacter marensis]|uniref:DUF2924 domain-containing protein n=1 Tax=Pelagerythrobacter marensis TaxID=543877 RepID=A0ABZ2D3A2_9SPHN
MEISVDLDVYKALTARLEHEGQTYSDVIRELLGLDFITEESPPESAMAAPLERLAGVTDTWSKPAESGFYSRGLFLPDGTKLRARYKGELFEAKIVDGHWLDKNGDEHGSPSAAASAITGNNVNGLRFWEACRPSDSGWRRLEFIRNRQVHNGGA